MILTVVLAVVGAWLLLSVITTVACAARRASTSHCPHASSLSGQTVR